MARWVRALVTFAMFLVPLALVAQAQRDVVPLKSWPAPLYFQPSSAESRERAKPDAKPDTLNALSSDVSSSLAATPARVCGNDALPDRGHAGWHIPCWIRPAVACRQCEPYFRDTVAQFPLSSAVHRAGLLV